MQLKYLLAAGVASLGLSCALTVPAFAQSTGSVDFEEGDIVVTAELLRDIAGVQVPNTTKAKQVLTQEVIGQQAPGQTVNDIINLIPGVSFQNNDPYGSAGGTMTIRGFDDTRISQTFDGVPLNDSGNYALYTNQQLDSELIEQVNVNLGSTDVDSPTAAASGSTVNYRTRNPKEEFGARLVGSIGDFSYGRIFGVIDTGEIGSAGTRAFFSASKADNRAIYGGIGRIDKQQYNAKIYQPIGGDGDFISIAGHYNANRNNFFGSVPLRLDATRVVGGSSSNRFPMTKDERFYEVTRCLVPTGVGGTADSASSCGSDFEFRYNPSNTGNVRVNSLFHLSDKLTLSIDPSFQYVKANGGGTAVGREGTHSSGYYGYISGSPYLGGVDLNGDGDTLDQVRVLAPSQTVTHRIGVISSLRYDINEANRVRIAYSYDRARHRQTGEVGYLRTDGFGELFFPIDDPILSANGLPLEKRDRLSYAILHQVSGEYSGDFMGDALHVNLGLRLPFFRRNLTNNCFTTSGSGFVDCFAGDASQEDAYAIANPNFATPQNRTFNYKKVLPNAGVVFSLSPAASVFANYSKGIQVPGTDNLYQAFYFPVGTAAASPAPETTDNFDLGVRYTSGIIQAQLTGWYTIYTNRLASSYDRDLNITIYRNLGKVDKYGIDGSIAVRPIPQLSVYAFGSYLKSKIQNDVQTGTDTSGNPIFAATAGKREAGAPVFSFGARATGTFGPVDIGVQAKRTGPRYVNDVNLPIVSGGNEIYPSKTPAYTLVDIDARLKLDFIGLGDLTYFQLNVLNVFDKLYVGGFDGSGTSNTSVPFAQIGSPRTFIGSVSFGF